MMVKIMLGPTERLFIKQFGLYRSGTNAVKALLEINFPNIRVLTTYLGNKHYPTNFQTIKSLSQEKELSDFDITKNEAEMIRVLTESKNLPVIIQIKKPIPWFDSYFRYQKKKILFTDPEAHLEFNKEWVDRGLELWEKCLESWINFSNNYSKCMIIEHVEFLENPDKTIEQITTFFDIQKNKKIELIEFQMKRGHYKEHGSNLINPYYKFDPSFHLENKWLDNYTPELLEYAEGKVKQVLDNNRVISSYEIDFLSN